MLNLNKKQYAKIKIELYKVIEDNTCVIAWKIYVDNEECLNYKKTEPKNGLFLKIEKYWNQRLLTYSNLKME